MTAVHEFSIPVTNLDAAGRSYRFPVRAAWMAEALEGHEASASDKDGELDVRLSKSGTDVIVSGSLRAELVAPCARCLEPVKIAVNQPISALMVPAARVRTPDKDDYEFKQEEAETHPYDGDTVVLDDLVRDELLLETPMIPLCREDCPGISSAPVGSSPSAEAPASKGDKPIDPRLLPLLQIKQRLK
jgi:uncharacterized protein